MTKQAIPEIVKGDRHLYDKCIDYFGFANRSHMVRECLKALEKSMDKGQNLKWPLRFEIQK